MFTVEFDIDFVTSLWGQHPARRVDFDTLYRELLNRVDAGLVHRTTLNDLELFVYTRDCVYEQAWDYYTALARGLILCPEQKKVVATPFPKFFNYSEGGVYWTPDAPMEVYEKIDGCLGTIYHHNGAWRLASKGSLDGDVQQAGEKLMHQNINLDCLVPGNTYCCEILTEVKRIVVPYDYEALVLLAAYDAEGYELSWDQIQNVADSAHFQLPQRKKFDTVEQVIEYTKPLDYRQEGFVIRFDGGPTNGYRIKVKSGGYLEVHKQVFYFGPLRVWECLRNMQDVHDCRSQLPEELWAEFDEMYVHFCDRFDSRIKDVHDAVEQTKHMTDKELGLSLNDVVKTEMGRAFVFHARKGTFFQDAMDPEHKVRRKIFESFRPKGNLLRPENN